MAKNNKFLFFTLLLVFVNSSCSSLKTRSQLKGSESSKVEEATPSSENPVEENQTTVPLDEDTKVHSGVGFKVGLVLGPGGVKALAHTAVIKELERYKIKPHKIIGIEWGALVGAMYSQNAKIHDVEWKLYKLKKESFVEDGLFSSAFKPQPIKKLREFIDETITEKNYSGLNISFECPAVSVLSGLTVWQNRGDLKRGLKHCLPHPPLFKPQSAWMADIYSVETAIKRLEQEGVNLIIVVDVAGTGDLLSRKDQLPYASASLLWHKFRKDFRVYKRNPQSTVALEWIQVNTRRFLLYDFDKRNDIVLAGESVAKSRIKEIVQKYGL